MKDPVNPIDQEIREWAYSEEDEPEQDFDMFLAQELREDYFKYVNDPDCNSGKYFIAVLYFIVGDAVRSNYQTNSKAEIEHYLKTGNTYNNNEIKLWIERSKKLILSPELFDYDYWCSGDHKKISI